MKNKQSTLKLNSNSGQEPIITYSPKNSAILHRLEKGRILAGLLAISDELIRQEEAIPKLLPP